MFTNRTVQYVFLIIVFHNATSIYADEPKSSPKYSQDEMRKLVIASLEKADVDMKGMLNLVFSEDEIFINEHYIINKGGVLEPDKSFFPSFKKSYDWFVRDGVFVRSPKSINGVAISPSQRAAAEEKWLKEKGKDEKAKGLLDYYFELINDHWAAIEKHPPYYKFKPSEIYYPFVSGRFIYMGEKIIENHNVAEIIYQPTYEEIIPNKASRRILGSRLDPFRSINLVFHIIPEMHRIVKLTEGFESIPIEALTIIHSMTMAEWDKNIWLPKKFSFLFYCNGGCTEERGRMYYTREYHSFKKAHVETNLSFDDNDAGSDPLREDVKSKTKFDMETPVPPKETPPSSKNDK
jgi:hypothetical protein